MNVSDSSTFDYVVVGAGSAGSALAARLSEYVTASVLLLEAGPVDKAANIHIPAAFGVLAPGQDAPRIVVDERHDVGARIRRGLRRLGERGGRGLVL